MNNVLIAIIKITTSTLSTHLAINTHLPMGNHYD